METNQTTRALEALEESVLDEQLEESLRVRALQILHDAHGRAMGRVAEIAERCAADADHPELRQLGHRLLAGNPAVRAD